MNKLDGVINDINKKYKQQVVKLGVDMPVRDRIPFSSSRVNYMTYGGIPLGIVVELYGKEGGGKTTTALDLAKQAQIYAQTEYDSKLANLQAELDKSKKKADLEKQIADLVDDGPRSVVYVDAENTLDMEWATLLGVDMQKVYMIRPQAQSAEQVLQMMLDMFRTGQVIMMVLDSIPMLIPQQLFDADLEHKSYGGVAAPMAQFAGKVAGVVSKHNALLVMINQVRDNMNNPYMENTPGGRALKHLYSVRYRVQKGSYVDNRGDELTSNPDAPAGNQVMLALQKTKVFRPDRRLGYYTLNYRTGIDDVLDAVDVALREGIITQAGSWYKATIGEEEIQLQGKLNMVDTIKGNPVYRDYIYKRLAEVLSVEGC